MNAGVDEVGRGPLAGPVLACAVILDPLKPIVGLKDSKKLSEKKRIALSASIKSSAIAWAIGIATVREIDNMNILRAALLAMERAVLNLKILPDSVSVDGNHLPTLPMRAKAIIKGDELIPEISAASIIAKVTRDYLMTLFAKKHPNYAFDMHKGYGTKKHLEAVRKFGVLPLHRRSFSPIKECVQAFNVMKSV